LHPWFWFIYLALWALHPWFLVANHKSFRYNFMCAVWQNSQFIPCRNLS
jgi:hypothetical protein